MAVDRPASPPTAASASGPRAPGRCPGLPRTTWAGPPRRSPTRRSCWAISIPTRIAAARYGSRPDLAEAAIRRDVAEPLGVDATTAAYAVFRVAVATMARAVKAVTTYRGRSPSAFAALAFGGNGPLLRRRARARARDPAGDRARGSRALLVGRAARRGRGAASRAGDRDRAGAASIRRPWRTRSRAWNAAVGRNSATEGRRVRRLRFADLRFRGQSSVLSLPLADAPLDRRALRALAGAFIAEHERTYGYASREEPIELVNVRLILTAGANGTRRGERGAARRAATRVRPATRQPAGLVRAGPGWLDTPLLGRADLAPAAPRAADRRGIRRHDARAAGLLRRHRRPRPHRDRDRSVSVDAVPTAPPFDLVVTGGLVIDGSGRPGAPGRRRHSGGSDRCGRRPRRRSRPSTRPPHRRRRRVVAPGFVDIHSHSDFTLLVDPTADSALAQGVTTEIVGNCGHGCAPIGLEEDPASPSNIYGWGPGVRAIDWRTVGGYLDASTRRGRRSMSGPSCRRATCASCA